MDYEMMGLEMMNGGMGAWMTADDVKNSLMGAAVGGAGIMVTATALSKWTQPTTGMFSTDTASGGSANGPMNFRRVKDLVAILVGVLGGRAIHGDGMSTQRRDSAMAFVGGVAGLGLADLVASWIPDDSTTHAPMVRTSLSGGYLSGADLRALEAAVATTSAAWQPSSDYAMNGVSVRTSQLQAPVVTDVDLGSLGAYMPYLA